MDIDISVTAFTQLIELVSGHFDKPPADSVSYHFLSNKINIGVTTSEQKNFVLQQSAKNGKMKVLSADEIENDTLLANTLVDLIDNGRDFYVLAEQNLFRVQNILH